MSGVTIVATCTQAATAQPVSMHRQPTAFLIGQADPAAHVPAQDAVLFDQVRHGSLLPLVEPADQRGQEHRRDESRRARRESLYHRPDLSASKTLGRAMRHYGRDYNDRRPYGALGHLTPSEYANRRQMNGSEAARLQLAAV